MPLKKTTRISTKYIADHLDEFEPGSRRRVLKNLLGLKTVRDIESAELVGYMKAERTLLSRFSADHSFTVADINLIHQMFLGSIYDWAGIFRDVNLSKGGFMFATVYAIPTLMREFENKVLHNNTPCQGANLNEVASKIAEVHTEFLLIHPYREGNGRTARLLATFMAYQADQPGIDFGFIGSKGKQFDRYVAAIQAGLGRDYRPMSEIVLKALERGQRLTGWA